MILKHVQTCHNAFDAIRYDSKNMSNLVQNQYDTNSYDSYDPQTCLNLLLQFLNVSKHDEIH